MKNRLVLFTVLVLCTLFTFAADQPAALTFDPGPLPFKFVAYGDMRMTDTRNHSDTDPDRRKALIDAIAQQKPKFVLISGDLVLNGSNGDDWSEYDKEMKPIGDAHAPVYPAIGNHEMHGDFNTAMGNYFKRFPDLNGSHYYTVRAANILIVTLDSEMGELKSPQREWLESVLTKGIPADVEFVIFDLHHPPYTHFGMASYGHEARHEEKALAAYLEEKQKKTRARFLVIAGHNHNYERYLHGDVMYVVSGGGGAQPYMPHRLPTDFYQGAGPTYHYCLITMEAGKLNFEMYKLTGERGKWGWEKGDNFALTYK